MTMVSREAVFQAAQKIAEGGARPSQTKVRELLGGGSFSDIGPLLRQWQQIHKAGSVASPLEMPEDAMMALNDLGKRLWSILSAQSATMIEAARQGFDTRCAELELEGCDLREALAALETENAEMAANIARMQQERAPTEAIFRELSQECGRLQARMEAADAANNRLTDENADLRARYDRQEEEVTALRRQVLDLTERQAATQGLWAATEARNDELTAENNSLHDRMERAQGRAEFAEVRADRLREDLEGRIADNAALRDQIVAAHAKHQEELGRMKMQVHRALAQQKLEARPSGAKPTVSKPLNTASESGTETAQRQ